MNPNLTDRALRLYRRSYPSYPEPSTVTQLECSAFRSEVPAIALSDPYGLLAAFRIRPDGSLEEAVPYPMCVQVPGQPKRWRMMLEGLPSMPSFDDAMACIVDPSRTEAICRWHRACLRLVNVETRQLFDRSLSLMCSLVELDPVYGRVSSEAQEAAWLHKANPASKAIFREMQACDNERLVKHRREQQLEQECKWLAIRATLLGMLKSIGSLNADLRSGVVPIVDPKLGGALSSVDETVLQRAGITPELLASVI